MTTDLSTVVDGLAFPERLRWHDDHLFSDMHDGTVHAWSPTGGDQIVVGIDGLASGLGWTPRGPDRDRDRADRRHPVLH